MRYGPGRLRQRGNLLAIAFAVIFILITLVAALHYQQQVAQRNFTQDEADLQFAEGYRWAAARTLGKTTASEPSWLNVSGTTRTLHANDIPDAAGAKLWSGMPNLEVDSSTKQPPGHDSYEVRPSTSNAALNVFGDHAMELVTDNAGGYAADAPNGQISLDGLYGWSNPSFSDKRKAVQAYSGVPTTIRAGGKIQVGEFDYGRAYSDNGPIQIGKGLALPFQGQPPPFADYAQTLESSLEGLRSQMDAAAASGDKTDQISCDMTHAVTAILSLMFGHKGDLTLSLEQAVEFPFPVLPQISPDVPGIFFEIYFHVPYPPDSEDFSQGDVSKNRQDAATLKQTSKDLTQANHDIQQYQNQLDQTSDPGTRDAITRKLNDARQRRDNAQNQIASLQDELKSSAGQSAQDIESQLTGPPALPETRADDENIPIPKTGMPGWNYSQIMKNVLGLLWNLVKAAIGQGSVQDALKSFYAPVRLVHFGGKDNVPEFTFDNNEFVSKASWTVPPGRSFRYRGAMTIKGDLWVQKGALFVVDGNLTLESPEQGAPLNPLDPCGRIFLGQGATLVVNGNLSCQGSREFGSVLVASHPGEVQPISSAILCSGTVSLPYGTFTGVTLDDLAASLANKNQGLADLAGVLRTLMTQVAPNLAKIAGPFHTRQPYFASYATTFQLTIIPPPVGPIPIPSPVPLPRKNILVPIFRGLTLVYAPFLNYTLGDNLYLQSDWWPFGQGRVPMVPKVDPTRLLASLGSVGAPSLSLDGVDWQSELKRMSQEMVKGALSYFLQTIVPQLAVKVVTSFVPYGGSLVGEALNQITDHLDGDENRLASFKGELADRITEPFQNAMRSALDSLASRVQDSLGDTYLHEVSGVLISGDTIQIGYEDGTPVSPAPPMVAGMLVAKNDVDLNCQYTVGSVVSSQGSIQGQDTRLLYTPYFTRASLYQPKATASDWTTRGLNFHYGADFDSGVGVDVGPRQTVISAQGWNR